MQVSILGCGWLGLPLAKALIANGLTIKGSTTTQSKVETLTLNGIEPYLINLANYSPAIGTEFLNGTEVLFINIPPKLRAGGSENYPAKIKMILPEIKKSGVRKVLFISSTSVYADNNALVTEDTTPNPDTDSGKQVLQAEQVLLENPEFKTTVLRFGGLIGEDRQPAKFLAGKENVANPDAPVNLIHKEDCIGIIIKILKKNIWGEIFNVASPSHPSRKEYYTAKAAALGLALPKFDHSSPSIGKTIVSDKIEKQLGYTFKDSI